MYEYPPILQGAEKKQIADMRDYLIRLIRTLDDEKSEAERVAVMNKSRQTQQTAQQQTPARPGLKLKDVLETIFSPGSLFINANDINPKELFGFGEWVRIKDRFILAAGDTYAAGSTGGEATHKLTVNEMASHGHQVYVWDNAGTLGNAYYYDGATKKTHSGARLYNGSASTWIANGSTANAAGSGRGDPSGGTALVGGNAAHNNMPPYLAVYVWQRVS